MSIEFYYRWIFYFTNFRLTTLYEYFNNKINQITNI